MSNLPFDQQLDPNQPSDPRHHFGESADPLEVVAVLHDPEMHEATLAAIGGITMMSTEQGLSYAVEFLRKCQPWMVEQMLLTIFMDLMHRAEKL